MFLARAVSLGKWRADTYEALQPGEISADAITADLRTRGNALSFWQCGEGMPRDVRDVALAIAAGRERIQKLDLVWVKEDELISDGHRVCANSGDTPVEGLADRHVDIQDLDYVRLGNVADRVIAAIERQHCKRFPEGHVLAVLLEAVRTNRVQVSRLKDSVRSAVEARLAL